MAPLKPLHERLQALSDKTLRNNPGQDQVAESYADMRADEELSRFLDRYQDEPQFQKRMLNKFAAKVAGRDASQIDYKQRYLELMADKDYEDSLMKRRDEKGESLFS
jgi:hypothetical protein